MPLTTQEELNILQHVYSELRSASRMELPSIGVVNAFAVLMRSVILKVKGSHSDQKKDIIQFYGAPTIVLCKVWELIIENNDDGMIFNKEHLLCALHFLKNRPNFRVMCKSIAKAGKKAPTEKNIAKEDFNLH